MFIFIKEQKAERKKSKRLRFWKNIKQLDRRLKLYLLAVLIFTLGNSSNAFVLLKAKAVGFDDISVILLYFVYNATASVFHSPLGN